jgi:two-component system sensor kinase FixL
MSPLFEFTCKESSDRLQAIVNSALDGLITIDSKGLVESFNPACERIFGYTSDEIIGRDVNILMPAPTPVVHEDSIHSFKQTGPSKVIGHTARELSGVRKNGSAFALELSISQFTLTDGVHYCGIIRDITER